MTNARLQEHYLQDLRGPALKPTPTAFLRAWFRTCPANQLLELRALRVSDRRPHQEWFALDAIEELIGAAYSLVEDHDCYFGVCPRVRPCGDKESVTHTPGLWADLDFKVFPEGEAGALRKLATFPVPPTWMVATGGGFHVYWQLREPVRADAAFEGRLRGIAKALESDHVTDRSRVLRVPGTWNHKRDFQVGLVSWPLS